MITLIAVELGRLRADELEAEQQYLEALKASDLAAARDAVAAWRKAANKLTRFVAQHPNPYRERG